MIKKHIPPIDVCRTDGSPYITFTPIPNTQNIKISTPEKPTNFFTH